MAYLKSPILLLNLIDHYKGVFKINKKKKKKNSKKKKPEGQIISLHQSDKTLK